MRGLVSICFLFSSSVAVFAAITTDNEYSLAKVVNLDDDGPLPYLPGVMGRRDVPGNYHHNQQKTVYNYYGDGLMEHYQHVPSSQHGIQTPPNLYQGYDGQIQLHPNYGGRYDKRDVVETRTKRHHWDMGLSYYDMPHHHHGFRHRHGHQHFLHPSYDHHYNHMGGLGWGRRHRHRHHHHPFYRADYDQLMMPDDYFGGSNMMMRFRRDVTSRHLAPAYYYYDGFAAAVHPGFAVLL